MLCCHHVLFCVSNIPDRQFRSPSEQVATVSQYPPIAKLSPLRRGTQTGKCSKSVVFRSETSFRGGSCSATKPKAPLQVKPKVQEICPFVVFRSRQPSQNPKPLLVAEVAVIDSTHRRSSLKASNSRLWYRSCIFLSVSPASEPDQAHFQLSKTLSRALYRYTGPAKKSIFGKHGSTCSQCLIRSEDSFGHLLRCWKWSEVKDLTPRYCTHIIESTNFRASQARPNRHKAERYVIPIVLTQVLDVFAHIKIILNNSDHREAVYRQVLKVEFLQYPRSLRNSESPSQKVRTGLNSSKNLISLSSEFFEAAARQFSGLFRVICSVSQAHRSVTGSLRTGYGKIFWNEFTWKFWSLWTPGSFIWRIHAGCEYDSCSSGSSRY